MAKDESTGAGVVELPAEENDEWGDFTVVATPKPVAGVTDVEIPPRLAELLKTETEKVLASEGDKELTLTAPTPEKAKLLSLYARAWGARQDPKLWIHKIPNRKGMKDTVARLSVEKDSDVAPENRPGRRQGK